MIPFGKSNQAVEKAHLEQQILEAEAQINALEAHQSHGEAMKISHRGRTKKDISRRRMANKSRRKNRK
jgi:hypothetical protein